MGRILKYTTLTGAITLVLVIMMIGASGATQTRTTGYTVKEPVLGAPGDVQDVTLTFKNYQYELSPSTLTRGVPVRMAVDLDSVYGCMRDVVIPSSNVRKYVREGDNVIEFTPEKAGTFNIMCSMNMGRGTFTVAEPDGSTGSYVEDTPAPSAGSCGSGGCGCG